MDIGLLLLRVVVGGLFVGHGTQKLFGWFGGQGIQGTAGFLESLGFRRSRFWAGVNGATEAGAGLLLALGALTPLAAAAIIGVMIVAAVTVHWSKGVWNTNGGYELNLVMAAGAGALAFVGPGAFSIDAAAGTVLAGAGWGLASVGLGALTAAAALAARKILAPAAEEQPEERQLRHAA